MKDFIIKLGAAIFYAMILLLILAGGSINGYKIKGILNIVVEMFKWFLLKSGKKRGRI